MADFNLRGLVRDVLAKSKATTMDAIAAEVLEQIPRNQTRAALAVALRHYVQTVNTQQRHTAFSEVASQTFATPVQQPVKQGVSSPSRSTKVAGIRTQARSGWQLALAQRIHIGGRQHKRLRDCTYEDLLAAAKERHAKGDQNHAQARLLDGWARLINEHNVKTFGELPTETQADALGRAA